MKTYENYIFDLYGTLVDIHTEEDNSSVWEKLAIFYGYYGALYEPEQLRERYLELIKIEEAKKDSEKKDDTHEAHPEVELTQIFLKLFTEKGVLTQEYAAVFAGQFFRILSTDYVKLYDGAEELLSTLKENGKKVYLLSNAQRIFTEYELHLLGIWDYFDDIFISSVYGVKKPDLQFFQLLLNKHHLNVSKSLMIGNDAVSDIAGAKKAGLDTFYIHSNLSPNLKEETFAAADKTKKTRTIFPNADYVLEKMDLKEVKKILALTY